MLENNFISILKRKFLFIMKKVLKVWWQAIDDKEQNQMALVIGTPHRCFWRLDWSWCLSGQAWRFKGESSRAYHSTWLNGKSAKSKFLGSCLNSFSSLLALNSCSVSLSTLDQTNLSPLDLSSMKWSISLTSPMWSMWKMVIEHI